MSNKIITFSHSIFLNSVLIVMRSCFFNFRDNMFVDCFILFLYHFRTENLFIYSYYFDYYTLSLQVLKVAILAEKYAVDYTWYVDVILNLIRIAGDYVSEEVWYRVIQIVINRDDVQGYAAKTVYEVR